MTEQQYPEPTVGALIFNPDGKLFLMKSHKWKGLYVMPGGHIELGESMEHALKREIREETSLDIYDIEFIGFQEFIFDDTFWERKHFIFFDYACKTDSTDVTLNSEAQEYVWIAVEDVLKLQLDPFTKKAINTYLKKKTK
jgi:nucleoside triphosphatase